MSDILGSPVAGADQEEEGGCGLLCRVFTSLQGAVTNVRHTPEGDYDTHNVTYHEKVLPDGSVLRTNKTVIHDTDENGNGFFFQSSVHHVIQEETSEEEEDIPESEEESVEEESSEQKDEEDAEGGAQISNIEDAVDPSENEIDQKFDATLSVSDDLFE